MPKGSHWIIGIISAAVLLGGGCATLANSTPTSKSYYVILGQRGEPLVAVTALTGLLASPEARVAALRDIAIRFIDRDEYDNASLIIEDALTELNRSSTLNNSFSYPPSRQISVHDPRDGSLIRAQLYLDIINIYRQLGEGEHPDALLRSALNEILRSAQSVEQRQMLIRYLTLINSLPAVDPKLLSRPIEAVLVYRYPILYGDLLQFLITFYRQAGQENLSAAHTFEQYLQLLIQEYAQQDGWISLAVYTAFQRNGWVSAAQLNRIRAQLHAVPVPLLADTREIETIARGLARGNGQDMLDLYRQLKDRETRCYFAFSDLDGLTRLMKEIGGSTELLACIGVTLPREQQVARAIYAVSAAIRNGVFSERLLQGNSFSSSATQNPDIYLRIAEEYLQLDNTTQARFYISAFSARFDQEVTNYQTASKFATIYGATHSDQQMIEQFAAEKNILLKIALLLELERRYGPIETPRYRQIIAETLRRLVGF